MLDWITIKYEMLVLGAVIICLQCFIYNKIKVLIDAFNALIARLNKL